MGTMSPDIQMGLNMAKPAIAMAKNMNPDPTQPLPLLAFAETAVDEFALLYSSSTDTKEPSTALESSSPTKSPSSPSTRERRRCPSTSHSLRRWTRTTEQV